MASLATLRSAASSSDHTLVLSTATSLISTNASSRSVPSDLLVAQRYKAIALLQLERYTECAHFFEEAGILLKRACVLEHAYALYKSGRLKDAEDVLKKGRGEAEGSGEARGWRELEAQIMYREEKFEDALRIYKDVMREEGEDAEEGDHRINLAAVYAQLAWQGRGDVVSEEARREMEAEDVDVFEVAYNAACGAIARGELDEARSLLVKAKTLCEGASYLGEEEKEAELVPILVQQVHVAARMGQRDETRRLQESMVVDDISDPSIKTVAQVNALASSAHDNPYLAQRHSEMISPPTSASDRLFSFQSDLLQRNLSAIDLQTHKHNSVRRLANKAYGKAGKDQSWTSPANVSAGILGAAARAKLATGREAVHKIEPLIEQRPVDVGLVLTVVQLHIQHDDSSKALTVLESLFNHLETSKPKGWETVRHTPGLVALAVALYRRHGQRKAVREELSKAAAYWQSSSSSSREASSRTLLKEAGLELLQSNRPTDLTLAGHAFSQLVSSNGEEDRSAQAGLVAAYATTDYAKAEPHLSSLDEVDTLIKGTNVDKLLEAGVPSALPPRPPPPSSAGKKRKRDVAANQDTTSSEQPSSSSNLLSPPTTQGPSSSLKRQKSDISTTSPPAAAAAAKVILGKDGKPLDPERWLPMKDRSYYKPPKAKKGAKGKKVETTQGGMPVESSVVSATGSGAGTPVRSGTPVGGGPSKKKKGKK